jgi:predicted flap endonuclease-1-like 5' DNA nuclease
VLTILAVVAVVAAFAIGYAVSNARRREANAPSRSASEALETASRTPPQTTPSAPEPTNVGDRAISERARVIRSFEAEAHSLRQALANRDAAIAHEREFAADRQQLFADLAVSRAETARYRQLVVDLENNAPPPLFGPGAPDDLKLIVGVGPVLERMLQQLGIATFRQIAYWSEREIDEIDAKLPEFPGRIRRDAWVTQARALHQSKYGEALPVRDASERGAAKS